ncbi:hypothetical protein P8C59_001052 [Phyllachora maydis]|uniref:Uncharacterized protein n=1 Tax=Phyllachora maydis TaxID=1825666 RepID=A0AAD9HXN0_9PEZI|nr:hypothetical protein P8C59_001052 [Phyllachora maydis]
MSRWTKRRSHVRSREITQHERTGQAHHAIVPDVLHRHLAPSHSSAATRVTPAAQDATMSLRATSTGAVDCGGPPSQLGGTTYSLFFALLAVLAATASAITISLPSGVALPSGVSLPSGVTVVSAAAQSTSIPGAGQGQQGQGQGQGQQGQGQGQGQGSNI